MSRRSQSRTPDRCGGGGGGGAGRNRSPRYKYKAGRVTRNPFLNFLRDFRKSNNALKVTELTRRGAEVWRNMNDRQKSPYCQLARQAPRRGRRRRTRRRRRRRGRRRGADGARSSGSSRSRSSLEDRPRRGGEPMAAEAAPLERKPSARGGRTSKSRSNVADQL